MSSTRLSPWFKAGCPWVASILLVTLASRRPEIIETWYAQGVYPFVIAPWSRLISWFPFSLGEFILYILAIWLLVFLFHRFIRRRGTPARPPLQNFALKFLYGLGLLYLCFLLVWGLNYYRLTWGELADFNLAPPQEKEIVELVQNLAYDANHLRTQINRSAFVAQDGNRTAIRNRASLGYTLASEQYPVLGKVWGGPKPISLSRIQTWSGISGYYMPFTAEPNVNQELPLPFYPAAVMHEMAHLHGFAREGEANYLAYLTCQYHTDPLFQYSGTLLAFVYAVDSLYQLSPETYSQVMNTLSPEVRQDLQSNHDFWARHQGPLTVAADRINNLYLKTNQQPGTASYNQVVQLLIAHQRAFSND